MAHKHVALQIANAQAGETLRIAYHDYAAKEKARGIFLLIHGFPQSSYQFRHVIPYLTQAGYRCIVPDYRGAGASSRAVSDFRKTTLAEDFIALLDELQITEPIFVIGHDIGGMIAYAMASRHPDRVKKVSWGECPLPGTNSYRRDRTEHAVQQFHFIFHSVADLPEALVQGKERIYISHFLEKITHNADAFKPEDIDHYTRLYEQPGAMRCAFGVYRAFEEDARDNTKHLEQSGKCQVPTLILSGEHSRHRFDAEEMALEVTEKDCLQVKLVPDSSHYLAEENPAGFADVLLRFVAE